MSANGSSEDAGVKKDEPSTKQRLNSYSAALASAPAKPAGDANGRGPPKKSFSDASKNKNRERNDSSSNNWRQASTTNTGAGGDRRNSYKNGGTNGKSKSSDRGNDKRRILSSSGKSLDDDENGAKGKERLRSTNSNGKQRRRTSNSVASNGESFDIGDDFDLDEPFSDSDDDAPYHREIQKPSLQIPRGRIRTLSGTVPPVGFSPKWGGPTMCLSCLEFFDLPDDMAKFADHLLVTHKIVVKEIELIVDPKRYIEHWRQRFAKEPIEKIFPKLVPVEGDQYHGKVDHYYQLSEEIPEDYSLRQRLAMRRLEEALSCQQRERDEVSFSMQCIFCRYVARGNRAKLIHHLYMIHHLNLGSPDNLVFVHEYLEHLREKLLRNECIYCEKVFSDRNVLMDHMRKRNHREVNPKNDYYDKFYIINYLELGKRWLDVLAEDFEDTMPSFQDSDDEEEDLEWHEWQEDNTDEDQLRVICLFCDDSHDKVAPLLAHLNDRHKFDLIGYIEKEKLDTYGRMKLINHLRKEIFNTPNFRAKVQAADGVVEIPAREKWDTEEDLVPMFANDHLLWMLESYLDENRPELAGHEVTVANDAPVVDRLIAESKANTIDGVVPDDLPLLRGNEPEKEELRELARAIRSAPSFD
uniref:C2H2-type domain-containing protein n=1 Tax=Panagrellus redivivus TaxID=6233 RepID=A0A7E4W6X2_PANRE